MFFKPALKSENGAHRIGRFPDPMDIPAVLAGQAIEGRTKIGEHDFVESPMCNIPAGSGGLSAASENAIVVSPFASRITRSTRQRSRKRGEPTVVRAARAKEKFIVVT